jgi:ABC-type Fe3+/spermidine/putrescine transport system ATPase subunit
MEASMIQIANLKVAIDGCLIIKGVSIDFSSSNCVGTAVMGSSGSGKTTFLKALSGILDPEKGSIISFNGDRIDCMAISERKFGVCFQDFLLLPNKTALENAMLACKDRIFVDELFAVFQVETLHKKYPYQLSGGEQQRIALIRAIAARPRYLLLDEPFSNLDEALKDEMVLPVKEILHRENIPFMMVTHNKRDAFLLCDSVIIFENGNTSFSGTIRDCYLNPPTKKVASLLGECNEIKIGSEVFFIRPENLELVSEKSADKEYLEGSYKVLSSVFIGGFYQTILHGGEAKRLVAYSSAQILATDVFILKPHNKNKYPEGSKL